MMQKEKNDAKGKNDANGTDDAKGNVPNASF